LKGLRRGPWIALHIELAPDGQIVVDTSRLYQWPKGQTSRFSDPGFIFIRVATGTKATAPTKEKAQDKFG